MASDEALRRAFSQLRPVCLRLTEEQTVENVDAVFDVLSSVDPSTLNDLQEYVLFPLRVLLRQPLASRSEKVFVRSLICVRKIISNGEISRWPVFVDLFGGLCCLISTRDPDIDVAPASEELKLEMVGCLSSLVRRLAPLLLVRLYADASVPLLGHAVTLLLSLAQREPMRRLRVESMNCLAELMLKEREDASESVVESCGRVFASFLPGIATGLSRVVLGDSKQGHEVTCVAISAWTYAVCLVLGDGSLGGRSDVGRAASDDASEVTERDERRSLVVERSADWINGTAEKMKILVDRLAPAAGHPHWKVRLEMVRLANHLLANCVSSLRCCLLPLLDVLIGALNDDYVEVATFASASVDAFRDKQISDGSHPLMEILEENIFHLATRLPHKIMDPDDGKKLSCVRLLGGYIKVLGFRINVLLRSDVHLRRFSQALMRVLEFDCFAVHFVQEMASGSPEMSIDRYVELRRLDRYQFKCFASVEVADEIVKVLRLVGRFGDLQILVDHFLDLFSRSSHYRKQSAFCIGEILVGATNDRRRTKTEETTAEDDDDVRAVTSSELESIVRLIVDEFLQPEHFYLTLGGNSSKKNSETISTTTTAKLSVDLLNSNVLLTCLLLDVVGRCAAAVGPDFEVVLIDVLYPVLEKVGSANARVNRHAVLCLYDVVRSCRRENVADLIRSGVDYLLNSVTLRSRHFRRNPEVLDVLRVVFFYSDKDILPLMTTAVYEVFDLLDLHYADFALPFVRVFDVLVTSISKWFSPEQRSNERIASSAAKNAKRMQMKTTQDVVRFFVDYKRQTSIVNDMEKNEEEVDVDDDAGVENDIKYEDLNGDDDDVKESDDCSKTKDPPQHVKLVKEILEKCQHLLTSSDPRVRLLVLNVVGQSCLILKPFQDDLLPLVHKVWKPFVRRFSDAEQVVAMKAFDTLRLIGFAAEDFLRRRVVDDVLPSVVKTLQKLGTVSLKAGPGYQHTMPCKLQLCVLKNLGDLCQNIDIKGRHVTALLHTCLPYLSARQPPCLQEASVETFKYFIAASPDNVWLLLNNVVCCPRKLQQPPVLGLPSVKVFDASQHNEYTDNVVKLLRLL